MILTKSDKFTSEYCISIVRIGEITPVENSDFLATTVVNGESIVIRKDQVKTGDILFYASNECALNKDFLKVNNLFEWSLRELNDNYAEVQRVVEQEGEEKAKRMVGFFNKHGRVRAIKLRGVLSMGYLFGLNELSNYNSKVSDLNLEELVNTDFDTVDGELFVKAYVPLIKVSNRRAKSERRQKKIKRFDRLIKNEFMFHYDTDPLPKYIEEFSPDDNIVMSIKAHGCVKHDTIVNTKEFGNKMISEIVNNKIECHIKSYDIELNQIVYVPISQFYKIPDDGEWYELELNNGKKITITGNNPVWCENLQCYRRVDELKGDEILVFDE